MDAQPRTFTRAEADALLPQIDRLLGEARALAEQLAATERQSEADRSKPRTNGQVHVDGPSSAADAMRRSAARQLRALLEQIQSLGIVVRDIRTGLIDFPSLREGRLINLCWRRGEPLELRWWHEVDAGFAGRQPL